MMRDTEAWRRFEEDFIRSEPPDPQRNMRLFEAMREWAIQLGAWERQDPLEGIEVVIKMARVLNSCSRKF